MLPHELIAKKRDGHQHSREELEFLVSSFTAGKVQDAEMAAWLMAAYIRGLDNQETVDLTRAMINTGSIIDLGQVGGQAVDKHSTGGVGDKTTLVVGPIVAALGLKVPKLSGRALGHTGGTLDKLAAIPGFRSSLYQEEFIQQIKTVGIAVAAQTADIVPADKRIYALRDRTATVESIPLIAASIISKKAAGGAKNILIDVKVGTGAFMRTLDRARALVQALTDTGGALGLTINCVITDMNQPVGRAIGNALEVGEAIDTLAGNGPADLREISLRLAAEMVRMTEAVSGPRISADQLERALDSGKALDVFARMIEAQGGDSGVINDRGRMPVSAFTRQLRAEHDGFLKINDCRAFGRAAAVLAGRRAGAFEPEAGAGLVLRARHGDRLKTADALVDLHYSEEDRCGQAERLVREAIEIVPDAPPCWPLVYE